MPFDKIDRIYIEQDDREKYGDKSGLSVLSPFFSDKENVDLFLFAIAYALKHGLPRRPLKSRYGYARTSYFKETEEMYLKCLAVYEKKSIDVLGDEKEILTIAEEYANAGIKLLYKELSENSGDYELEIEEYLLTEVQIPDTSY